MNADASAAARFEAALTRLTQETFVLRLYVVGATVTSQRAIANLTDICQRHLEGRYTLDVIDIYQRPELARGEQIIAVPTLIRASPEPVRRIVGDLSDAHQVLRGLDLLDVDD